MLADSDTAVRSCLSVQVRLRVIYNGKGIYIILSTSTIMYGFVNKRFNDIVSVNDRMAKW